MKNNNKITVVEQEKTIYTTKDISLHDCTIIVQRIHEENKIHGYHMLEYTAEELFHEISIGSYSGIKDNDMLIGCIKLTPVQKNGLTVFERGSLFIHKDYRNQGLGKHLVETILNDNKTLPIYSVTNVEAVKKINKSLGQYEYTAANIPKKILEVIETAGKLLENDVIYSNEILNVLIQKLI